MAGKSPAAKSRVRLFLVFWLAVISMVAFLDRTNISVAGVPIAREFGIDKIHLGWVFSAFLLGYALFLVPSGWLAWRYGPRKSLTLGLLWWGVFSAATALVSPLAGHVLLQFIVVRFVLGMGEAVVYPASNQFIAMWVPTQERAKANGWIFAGVGIGSGLAPPIITTIMLAYGWRASFWFSALIGVAAALVWYLASRDRPDEHPQVSPAELAHIRAGISGQARAARLPVPWRHIFTSRNLWVLTLSYFTFGYVAFLFVSWFFIYLADARGLDLRNSAIYSMMPFAAMSAGCIAGGIIGDWLSRTRGSYVGRCVFPFFSLLVCAVLMIVGARAEGTLAACVLLAAAAGTLYFTQSSYYSITADIAGSHAGIVSAVMGMGVQIGGAVTASLTPWLAAAFGWNMAFYVAAGFAVLGAATLMFVNPVRLIQPVQGKDDLDLSGAAAAIEASLN